MTITLNDITEYVGLPNPHEFHSTELEQYRTIYEPISLSGNLIIMFERTKPKDDVHTNKIILINLLNPMKRKILIRNNCNGNIAVSDDMDYFASTMIRENSCILYVQSIVSGNIIFDTEIGTHEDCYFHQNYQINTSINVKWNETTKTFIVYSNQKSFSFNPKTRKIHYFVIPNEIECLDIRNVIRSPNGKYLLTMKKHNEIEENTIYKINNNTLEKIHQFKLPKKHQYFVKIRKISWSNDSNCVAISANYPAYQVIIFNIKTNIEKKIIKNDYVVFGHKWRFDDKYIMIEYNFNCYLNIFNIDILCSETLEVVYTENYCYGNSIWSNCGSFIVTKIITDYISTYAVDSLTPPTKIISVFPNIMNVMKPWLLHINQEINNRKLLHRNVSEIILQKLGILDKSFKYVKNSVI
jgi:hypothetical protein